MPLICPPPDTDKTIGVTQEQLLVLQAGVVLGAERFFPDELLGILILCQSLSNHVRLDSASRQRHQAIMCV